MTTAAQIAERLGLAKSGEGFTGFCPSCGYDRGFSVAKKHGKVLVHCHAGGCTQADLIQALREWEVWQDLPSRPVQFPTNFPSAQPPPTRGSSSLALRQSGSDVRSMVRAAEQQFSDPAAGRLEPRQKRAPHRLRHVIRAATARRQTPKKAEPRAAAIAAKLGMRGVS
jgi:hypothetical protein